MKKIENLEDFNVVKVQYQFKDNDECILRLFDNKSDILLQTIVVNHPVSFMRNLPEISQSLKIPVSDVEIKLIGFVSDVNGLIEVKDCPVISPYIYFKRPDELSVNVASDGSNPPVEP